MIVNVSLVVGVLALQLLNLLVQSIDGVLVLRLHIVQVLVTSLKLLADLLLTGNHFLNLLLKILILSLEGVQLLLHVSELVKLVLEVLQVFTA